MQWYTRYTSGMPTSGPKPSNVLTLFSEHVWILPRVKGFDPSAPPMVPVLTHVHMERFKATMTCTRAADMEMVRLIPIFSAAALVLCLEQPNDVSTARCADCFKMDACSLRRLRCLQTCFKHRNLCMTCCFQSIHSLSLTSQIVLMSCLAPCIRSIPHSFAAGA